MRSEKTRGLLDELEGALAELREVEVHGGRFVAERVISRPWIRVAVGLDGIAVLLPAVPDAVRAPIEFAHLRVRFNVKCTLETSKGLDDEILVIVQCLSTDIFIEKAFLQALSVVLPYGDKVSASELESSIRSLAELFQILQNPASGTVVGLWGELFVISEASNISLAIDAWHALPMERFDFGQDRLRVEVKTTLQSVRSHQFSLEQVRPAKNVEVIIASLLTASYVGGPSIAALLSRICASLDPARASRALKVAMQTLGRDWEVGKERAFDEQLARQTLNWYSGSAIPAVSGVADSVSQVRFRSDLTGVKPLSVARLRLEGNLAQALIGSSES